MSIKGLDDFITGKNDPNAPFNQTDFAEEFSDVLDYCDWVTDEMWNDDKVVDKIGKIIYGVVESFFPDDKYFTTKEKYLFIKEHSKVMADKLKEAYEN